MVDVCLAAAPFLSAARPALGASALIGELKALGISARLAYLNLAFAERVGLDLCEDVAERMATKLLIGEWVFAHRVRGDARADALNAYEDRLRAYLGSRTFAAVDALRAEAGPFADEMAERLLDSGARIIGFTTSFQQNCASLAIAKAIKARDPDRVVVFGGANCDGPMGAGLARAYPFIDHVFQGEADVSFPHFVRERLEGRGDQPRLIPGAPVMDMDGLAVPEFGDFFETLEAMSWRGRVVPGLLFESSRGCWWGAKHHCTFCGLNGTGMSYRSKSYERVLEELSTLRRRHGVALFEAADNIMNMTHVAGIFDRLADERDAGNVLEPARFFYEIKSNMRPDLMERIARGGVTWVQPGIESLHDTVLEKMKKGVKGLHNVRLLRSCQEIGIRPVWNLLAGFPGERADYYDWMAGIMPALEHFDPPTGYSVIRLDRFSPYHKDAETLGFANVRPADAYAAIYGLTDDLLEEIAYFFEGEAADMPAPGYLSGVANAIERWRTAHAPAGETEDPEETNTAARAGVPELTITPAGPVHILKDTRSVAGQQLRILLPSQARVLSDLREPGAPETIAGRAAPLPDPDADWMEIYRELLTWKLIVEDPFGHAVSLVCETGRRIHDDDDLLLFPGGSVLTPAQEARLRARPAKTDALGPLPAELTGLLV